MKVKAQDIESDKKRYLIELAKKYRMDPRKINYILSKFDSMEKFVMLYKSGELDLDDEDKKIIDGKLLRCLDYDLKTKYKIDELSQKYGMNLGKTAYILLKFGSIEKFIIAYLSDELDLNDEDKEIIDDHLLQKLSDDIEEKYKISELSQKYRILPRKIYYILSKYGSMDNFIKAYINNQLSYDDQDTLEDNLLSTLIIDTAQSTERETLLLFQYVYGTGRSIIHSTGGRIVFANSKQLMEQFHKLSKRQQEIISLKCGIYKGKKSSKEVGTSSSERKLRMASQITSYNTDETTICLPEEELEKRAMIVDKIYHSSFLFKPDSELEKEPHSITNTEILELAEELCRIRRLQGQNIEADSIRKLKLPKQVWHPLEYAGILTITQLKTKSAEELMQIEHIGKKAVDEIQLKLQELMDPGLRQLKTTRDELAQQVKTLELQLQDAKRLLASYDALLNGNTQKNETTPDLE